MIPLRYQNARYDDIPSNITIRFEQIPNTRKGLYIHGGVGTGKTHIAYTLYANMNKIKRYGMFKNMAELLREMRLDIGRQNVDKSFIEEKLMEYNGLLFLDDVGSERMTEWVEETFYLIINKRYENMLPIIFTSNLSIQDLANRVGDRIASRIVEMCDIISIDGNDKRIK